MIYLELNNPNDRFYLWAFASEFIQIKIHKVGESYFAAVVGSNWAFVG